MRCWRCHSAGASISRASPVPIMPARDLNELIAWLRASAATVCWAMLPLAVSPAVAEYLFYRNSSVLADHQQFGVPLSRLDRYDLAHERAREAEHTRIRTRLGDPDRVCQTVMVDGSEQINAPGAVVIVCRSFGRPW
jgi:hypothetical protein